MTAPPQVSAHTQAAKAAAPTANGSDDPPLSSTIALQRRLLPSVSRTFALTIPQLPAPLDLVVTNAYLLCRVADAIEDEPGMSTEQRKILLNNLRAVIEGGADAKQFVIDALAALTEATALAEREAVGSLEAILSFTHSLPATQQEAIRRCLVKMCAGMATFTPDQERGLRDIDELDRYCYTVAGVVGELLTDLFCDFAPDIAAQRKEMAMLAASFGQGLQMTNILKDIWEDLDRGCCWLPRDVFLRAGAPLSELTATHRPEGFERALEELIALAHSHLKNALTYSLHIPARHRGIRCFCLWSIGLAVATVRKIHQQPAFENAEEVKISRSAVAAILSSTRINVGSDFALRAMFRFASRHLPLSTLETQPRAATQPPPLS